MSKNRRKFVDDGWAIWIEGDDTSTVYLNDWINPVGKSYVDIAVRVRGIMIGKKLHMYVPFEVSADEIEDISLHFQNTKFLQATFNVACLMDFKKNAHASEIAYNGKTVDILHISTIEYQMESLDEGTLIHIDLQKLHPFLDNDEAYFIWRMPHRSLDEVFQKGVDGESIMARLRDLITSPVIMEKYGYSVRVNESRFLPERITRIGAFHRQKLNKAIITISIHEDYEVNDSGCYRIHRLEEKLYREFLPPDYDCEDVITYEWIQNREYNEHGQFNFYNSISKNWVSHVSMILYLVCLVCISIFCNYVSSLVLAWIENFF